MYEHGYATLYRRCMNTHNVLTCVLKQVRFRLHYNNIIQYKLKYVNNIVNAIKLLTLLNTYVSASEILGPITDMTLLRKLTPKQCITFHGIFRSFSGLQKWLKNVSMSKFFKNSKHICYLCTIVYLY